METLGDMLTPFGRETTPEVLARRLRILLPPEYHDTFAQLEPTPMRGAGLKYDADGRVAWNEIWQAFCDLAMAGGPPHKGHLLGPGAQDAITARPGEYLDVLEELGRGITLASELPTSESPHLGWVRVDCHSQVMAGWMLRHITMENVAVRSEGRSLDLPASPDFRVEKEIKNVVTVVAKTCHYWTSHIPREQRIAIGELIETLDRESPLIVPDYDADNPWRPIECASVAEALTLMRAFVASNVLARREDSRVFVPAHVFPGGLADHR
jgi:hypothetical protein